MIEQEKMIVEALPSLYPLQKFEEDAVHTVIDALPHWIPVTERLPEASGHYLVTEIWMGERVIVTRYYNKRKEGESFWSGHPQQTVFAWMPLPEPYREKYNERT